MDLLDGLDLALRVEQGETGRNDDADNEDGDDDDLERAQAGGNDAGQRHQRHQTDTGADGEGHDVRHRVPDFELAGAFGVGEPFEDGVGKRRVAVNMVLRIQEGKGSIIHEGDGVEVPEQLFPVHQGIGNGVVAAGRDGKIALENDEFGAFHALDDVIAKGTGNVVELGPDFIGNAGQSLAVLLESVADKKCCPCSARRSGWENTDRCP